jgi:hypothetical protein
MSHDELNTLAWEALSQRPGPGLIKVRKEVENVHVRCEIQFFSTGGCHDETQGR